MKQNLRIYSLIPPPWTAGAKGWAVGLSWPEGGKGHRNKEHFKTWRIQSIHEKSLHKSVRRMCKWSGASLNAPACPCCTTQGLKTWKPAVASPLPLLPQLHSFLSRTMPRNHPPTLFLTPLKFLTPFGYNADPAPTDAFPVGRDPSFLLLGNKQTVVHL